MRHCQTISALLGILLVVLLQLPQPDFWVGDHVAVAQTAKDAPAETPDLPESQSKLEVFVLHHAPTVWPVADFDWWQPDPANACQTHSPISLVGQSVWFFPSLIAFRKILLTHILSPQAP